MNKKILSNNNIKSLLLKLKKQKMKIVLCHGVFDLLHLGHFEHFNKAKELGDILIVSVSSDRFVNKGPNQPFFSLSERIKSLTNIESINYIIESDQPDAVESIKLIKPHFYCKGKDYKNNKDDLTGKIEKENNILKKNGGKIFFTDEISFSSSKLLNKKNLLMNGGQKNFLNSIKKNYNFENIKTIINNFKELNVLVIGETIIDKYVFCEAVGKSGKDPMLVLRQIKDEKYLGGAAAVANHVSAFTKNIKFISIKGDNKDEDNFINERLNKVIKKKYFIKEKSPTILKTRFVDKNSNHKMLGVYNVNNETLSKEKVKEIINYLKLEISKYDVVLTFDYGHGFINTEISKFLSKKSKFFALNAQVNSMSLGSHSIEKYLSTSCLIINESELRHELRDNISPVENLVKKLFKKIKFKECVVTMGEKGALVYSKQNNLIHKCPAFASRIIDKIGAGDSFLPLYALTSVVNNEGNLSLLLGSLSAAQSVESIGNSNIVSKIKILKTISHILK